MALRFLYTCCFLLLAALANAQSRPNNARLYNTANGLSSNSITALRQDATGYIWIGTVSGLNRYNGTQFQQFHSTSDSMSLPAEELTGVVWIDKDRLAFYGSGLHIVNTKTGATQNIFIPYHDKKYQFKFNIVMGASGDAQGNVYVLTRSGFYQFNSKSELVFRFDYYSEAEVPITHFYFGSSLFALDENRLLIISSHGLYLFKKSTREFKKMTTSDCPQLAEFMDETARRQAQILQVSPGEFFVIKTIGDSLVYIDVTKNKKRSFALGVKGLGAQFGWRSRMIKVADTLYYITGQFAGFFKMRFTESEARLYPEKQYENYFCSSLLKDADNNVWIGTNRGLLMQDHMSAPVERAAIPPTIAQQYPNLKINQSLALGGKLYVATNEAGLCVFDKTTLRFEGQFVNHSLPGTNYIRALAQVDSFTILLGTLGNLILFDTRTNTQHDIVPDGWHRNTDWTSTMFSDSKQNIWIGSHQIYTFNKRLRTFTIVPSYDRLLDVPFDIAEDKQGNIWMACHGLARYNISQNKYDLYIDSFPYSKMPDKQVNSLAVDATNKLWFHSNNNGLIAYDAGRKTFRQFTRQNGLPDDNINSTLLVGNKLWIACYSGIACIDIHTLQITSFSKEDGFPDGPIPKGSKLYYDEQSHRIYIGFLDEVVRFHPDSILLHKQAPRVFIESISIAGKRRYYLPDSSIAVSWKDEALQVAIGTVNFWDGTAQRFAYRVVKDNDGTWIPLGSQTGFSLAGLRPGTYQMQVKVFSPYNRWPEQIKSLTIVVSTPFWLKRWFLLLVVLLVIGLMYLLVKWRTYEARKKEKIKTHIEALKADHYKSQYELEQVSNYFSSSLADKHTAEDVLWDVAENLIGRMDYEDCIIYLWNKDKTKMLQKAAWGPKGKPGLINGTSFEVAPGQGIVGYAIETRQPVLVPDTRKDPRYRVDDQFRLSEVAVPIIHNNELLGIIDSEHSRVNYFTERDIQILTTIATLIGNKIKQLESEQSLEAKQKELAGINEQLAEARLSALQAQMNPHFVFNALNSIKRMILDGANDKASRYLSKFALMIRLTLEHSKHLFVTLDENIEYIQAYLDMEKLRFDDSFTYRIHTDENVDTTEVAFPAMMVQPLVENAIWHGLMHATNDKKIDISFVQDETTIICTVEDNGIGIRQSEKLREKHRPLHRSVGLENLRRRIKIMNDKYHTDCSLRIEDLQTNGEGKQGTRALLQFNLMSV